MTIDENLIFINKIKKLIPFDQDRCLVLLTLTACSAIFSEFIMEKYQKRLHKLPLEIKHACALASSNMIAFLSDGEDAEMIDVADIEYKMSEQTQEDMFRRMKFIIETLYKDLQENDHI